MNSENRKGQRDIAQLRVLFAVDSRFPGLGGAENQALKLAVALRARGAFVEFVTPRVLTDQSLHETYHGFTIHRIDYPHIKWFGSLALMWWFAVYLRTNRQRFDAVHIHITHLLAASAGLSRGFIGLPIVTKISGYYEFEGGVLDHTKRFMPLNFLLRHGIRKVDFVQTISVQTREKLLRAGFGNDQIRFIPNGIDTSAVPVRNTPSATVTIGYCGRLREVKGVHILLEAFALVMEARPGCGLNLKIAGSGETFEALAAQASALGVSDSIEWLGLLEETQPFYRSLDIYVQPSFAEGLPNSVMEAMAEQKAVIASDIGGNNELVEHEVTGLRFKPGCAQSLGDMIIRLVDNVEMRNSLAESGRLLVVNRYEFDQVVSELVELYSVQS